jgi:hypothetical protein
MRRKKWSCKLVFTKQENATNLANFLVQHGIRMAHVQRP